MDLPKLKVEPFNSTSVLLSVIDGPIFDHPNVDEKWTAEVTPEGVLTLPDEIWERLGWEGESTVEWLEGPDGSYYLVNINEKVDSGDEGDDDGDAGA